jgi:hypothetical protein
VLHRALYIGPAAALVGGFLLLAAPFAAAEPVGGPLTLSPDHGRPGASFSATYQIFTINGHCTGKVRFFWDLVKVAEVGDGFRNCVASVRITPPGGDRGPGPHAVTARPDNYPQATATYRIDPVNTPSPTPTSPSPSTVPPATPTPTRSRSSPTPDAISLNPPATPYTEDSTPAAAAGGSANALPVVEPPSSGGSGGAGWAFLAGGALILVGASAMGLLFLNSRRLRAVDTDVDTAQVGLDNLWPERPVYSRPPILPPLPPLPPPLPPLDQPLLAWPAPDSGAPPGGPTPGGPTPGGPTPGGPTPSGPTPSRPAPEDGPPEPAPAG